MVFEKIFVVKKLKEIKDYLDEIESLFSFSDTEIKKDSYKLHTAERLLQVTVDALLDVNQHFIRELNLKVSDDLQGTFVILGENKIMPKGFVQKIAPVVGLRNRIVHRYETIDKTIFISSFRKNFPDFKKYLKFVNDYLKTKL